MSQLHTCPGPVASSSGLIRAGWVAWRRRSPAAPVGAQHPVHRRHRAQVGALVEQRRPGLRRPTCRRTGGCSAPPAPRARSRRGQRVRRRRPRRRAGRGPAGAARGSGWPATGPTARTRSPSRCARASSATAGAITASTAASVSALSESSSKSACAFPTTSRAAWVLASSRLGRSFVARSRSISACSGVRSAAPRRPGVNPASAPGVAGPAPLDQMRGVQPLPAQQRPLRARLGGVVLGQDRRLVLGGERAPLRPVSSRTHAPIIDRRRKSAIVIVIVINLSRPVQREEQLPEVSHTSLTHRGLPCATREPRTTTSVLDATSARTPRLLRCSRAFWGSVGSLT